MKWSKTFILLLLSATLVAQEEVVVENPSSPDVICIRHQMPEFPGGQIALMNYIALFSSPVQTGYIGTVYVQFDVEANGQILKAEIVKGSGIISLDNAILEYLKNMPQWKAGSTGEAIKYMLPIKFS